MRTRGCKWISIGSRPGGCKLLVAVGLLPGLRSCAENQPAETGARTRSLALEMERRKFGEA